MTETIEKPVVQEKAELTGFERAVAMADLLRKTNPEHELLRFVRKGADPDDMDRWDKERIERFWQTPRGEHMHNYPPCEIDRVSFNGVAEAMEKALSARLKIRVKRIKVLLDPSVDVFNVEIEQNHPPGIWKHSAGSEAELKEFLEGVRAGASIMGMFVGIPDIPSQPKHQIVWHEPEPESRYERIGDDLPF